MSITLSPIKSFSIGDHEWHRYLESSCWHEEEVKQLHPGVRALLSDWQQSDDSVFRATAQFLYESKYGPKAPPSWCEEYQPWSASLHGVTHLLYRLSVMRKILLTEDEQLLLYALQFLDANFQTTLQGIEEQSSELLRRQMEWCDAKRASLGSEIHGLKHEIAVVEEIRRETVRLQALCTGESER